MTRLNWKGDIVLAHVRDATAKAIDETTKDAAEDAQRNPAWVSQHRGTEGEIENESARRRGRKISGRFGVTRRPGKPFDLFLEFGSPFMRPAADRNFPLLASRIKRRVK